MNRATIRQWFRDQQRRALHFVQHFPTWLALSLTVLLLSFLTLWFHDDLVIRSPHDLLTRPVLKVLFENAESIAIVAAVVLYFKEAPDRKEQKHYEAWQVVDSAAAAKVATSYARMKALQDLNRDGVSLKGIDAPEADLEAIELPGADLTGVDMPRAVLAKADLSRANFSRANFGGADFSGANLTKAKFAETDFSQTNFSRANLSEAKSVKTDLSDANLSGAKLVRATFLFSSLIRANLSKASLSGAELGGSDLRNADLSGANLLGANLIGVKNLTPEQVKAARYWESASYSEDFRQQLGLPPKPEQTM